MKRKSVGGFITGLLGVVGSGIVGWYVYLILAITLDLANAAKAEVSGVGLIVTLGLLYLVSILLGVIGICFYFKKAKTGGIIMTIATICNAALPVYSLSTDFNFGLIIIFIPTVLLFVSAILGLCSKKQLVLLEQPAVSNVGGKKYCVKCGAQLNANDGFCSKCGTKQ